MRAVGEKMEAFLTFKLGRITVGVSGDTELARSVTAELDPVASDGSTNPDLLFRFLDRVHDDAAMPGEWEVSGRRRHLRVSLSSKDGPCAVVYVAAQLPWWYLGMPRPTFKMAHPAYIDQFEYLAGSFLYQVFDGVVQALSLTANQSFLHTAAVEKEGVRVAIVTRGGMGKTGSLLRLVVDHGWRYVSDDWTIVDDSGVLYLSHKSIHVHPRNLSGLRDGEKLVLRNRGLVDRTVWRTRRRVTGQRGLKRQSHPVALLGPDRVGSSGPLSGAFLVRRGDIGNVAEVPVDASEFAESAAAITTRELAPSMGLWEPNLNVNGPEQLRLHEIHARTAAVLRRALHGGPMLRMLTVPRTMPEPQIEDCLVRTIAAVT
jgi:hypothetical protein